MSYDAIKALGWVLSDDSMDYQQPRPKGKVQRLTVHSSEWKC